MFNDPVLYLSVVTDQMKVLNIDMHSQIHIKIHKRVVPQAPIFLCMSKHELHLTFTQYDYSLCRSVLPFRAHNLHLFSQNFRLQTGMRPFIRSSEFDYHAV